MSAVMDFDGEWDRPLFSEEFQALLDGLSDEDRASVTITVTHAVKP